MLISIIVPVFNIEHHVNECMLSLRCQKFEDFEVIVIDDGSSDRTKDIVLSHAKIDSRIRLFEQSRRGVGGARSFGLSKASGEFIVFVDGDDFVSTQFIKTLVEEQRKGCYDIVSSVHIKISEDSNFLSPQAVRALPHVNPPLSVYEAILGMFSYSVVWGRLIKSEVFPKFGTTLPEALPHTDLFFSYKIFRNSESHRQLDHPLYFWRQRYPSTSRSFTDAHLRVPSLLRSDTSHFFESVSATDREYVLAARRNIVFLNSLWTRAKRSGPALLQAFQEMIRCDKPLIRADFQNVEDAGLLAEELKNPRSMTPERCNELRQLIFDGDPAQLQNELEY